MSSTRWAGLAALACGLWLSACATQAPVQQGTRRSPEIQATPAGFSEQDCPQDRPVVLRCSRNACTFLPRSRPILVSQAAVPLPAPVLEVPVSEAAQGYYGDGQDAPDPRRQPVFIIPWNQALQQQEEQQRQQEKEQQLPWVRALREDMRKRPYEKHHIFPQAFKPWFDRQKINVHEYTILIPVEDHRRIHRGKRGGPWNAAWDEYITAHQEQAEPGDIFRYAGELLFRFELTGPIMQY